MNERPPRRSGGLSSRRWPRTLVVIGAVIMAILFVVENHRDVTTSFVFFTVTAKLWIGLLVCLGLGVLVGYLVAGQVARRQDD